MCDTIIARHVMNFNLSGEDFRSYLYEKERQEIKSLQFSSSYDVPNTKGGLDPE